MYNNHSDFNDENNLYHYSYRDSSQQPPQEPVQDLKPHKEKKPTPRWAKITAIVLAGAICERRVRLRRRDARKPRELRQHDHHAEQPHRFGRHGQEGRRPDGP